ncbi:MAG: DHA2 family efflux MFS transporter permease subunit [Alicyclobacillaceae bacterium]|nr:DHA2 family efflux MFS transporter permease subunit [Alicyclobacillaceae bacterium]
MVVLVLGAFVTILNQTLLNVAIPHLMTAFNESANTIQWLSTAFMLTNGVLIPLSAYLIGTFTTRQLFIASMASFTLGALICSLAPTFTVLLIGRIVQALGAGVIMPLMMTVVLNLFPPQTRGKSMGVIGIAMIFAPAVGPTLSGWLVEDYSWRLLFWIVIPIAVIDIILAVLFLRNATDRTNPKLDWPGVLTSIVGFGALLYGFSEAGNKGWHDSAVVGSLVIGIVFVILFVARQLVAKEPLLRLEVFRYPMFTLSTIVSCVVNMAMFGAMILLPIYIQNLRGYTPLQAGLLLMPGAILMGIMSPVAGALFDRIGPRPLVLFGLSVTTVTTWMFAHLTDATTYRHVMWLYTARMFGMSFIMMTVMTAGLNQLPRRLNSHGTAAANTARTVAASLGTAILVSVMSTRANLHIAEYANTLSLANPKLAQAVNQLSGLFAAKLGQTLQAGQAVTTQLLYGMVQMESTIQGINDAFIVATVFCAVALVLSAFLHKVAPREDAPKPVPRTEETALAEVPERNLATAE